MKFSKTTSAAVILLSNALSISAFTPTPSYTQQRTHTSTTTTTSHNIVSDPYLISSAVDADIIGQLALILPVGLGIAMGNSNSKGQYKSDNTDENVDLAVLGGSAVAVLDKVEEEETVEETPEPEVTPAQKGFFGKKETKAEAVVVEKKKEPEPTVPVVTAKPGKASIPSKELLASTEKAKAEVQKKGVQETKDKMSSKASPPAPPAAVEEETKEVAAVVASTELAETKKPGGKRRIVKGVTLIVAAGAVAVARNVVKAYLGRGML